MGVSLHDPCTVDRMVQKGSELFRWYIFAHATFLRQTPTTQVLSYTTRKTSQDFEATIMVCKQQKSLVIIVKRMIPGST